MRVSSDSAPESGSTVDFRCLPGSRLLLPLLSGRPSFAESGTPEVGHFLFGLPRGYRGAPRTNALAREGRVPWARLASRFLRALTRRPSGFVNICEAPCSVEADCGGSRAGVTGLASWFAPRLLRFEYRLHRRWMRSLSPGGGRSSWEDGCSTYSVRLPVRRAMRSRLLRGCTQWGPPQHRCTP